MNIDRLKAQERIQLRHQQRANAQVKRSQFNHEQALSRIAFSAEMAVDRLAFQHDVILPRMEEIDAGLTAGVVETRALSAGDEE